MNPFSPSRSILPAQTRHCIGLNSGVPKTSPRQIMKTATIVSTEISSGNDATVDTGEPGEVIEDKDAVLVE